MPHADLGKNIAFEAPGKYRIDVKGSVPDSFASRLGGMLISEKTADVTTLVGQLLDQTELNGVLGTLYQLHLPILKVERLNHDPM